VLVDRNCGLTPAARRAGDPDQPDADAGGRRTAGAARAVRRTGGRNRLCGGARRRPRAGPQPRPRQRGAGAQGAQGRARRQGAPPHDRGQGRAGGGAQPRRAQPGPPGGRPAPGRVGVAARRRQAGCRSSAWRRDWGVSDTQPPPGRCRVLVSGSARGALPASAIRGEPRPGLKTHPNRFKLAAA